MSQKGESKENSAFVVGYSGEIGKELIKELYETKAFQKVILIGRRKIDFKDENLSKMEQRVINFEKLEEEKEKFKNIEVGFCCLGTTKGQAGAEMFYRVDHDYVLRVATIAKDMGCKQFHLVSSSGANKDSFFLYPKTKGQVEDDVKKLNFHQLLIYRPSFLLCDRKEKRIMEKIFNTTMKPIIWLFPTFISVPTSIVAKSMVSIATSFSSYFPSNDKVNLVDNKLIHKIGSG